MGAGNPKLSSFDSDKFEPNTYFIDLSGDFDEINERLTEEFGEELDENLGYQDKKLMENHDYNMGYKEQAHKIKKKKVWNNFAIGSGVFLGLYILSGALIATTMVY